MTTTIRLDRAHVLVTGAGRGIGRKVTLELARVGAHVYAVSRSADELEEACSRARDLGGHATPMVADITSEDDLRRIVADVPRIDILVNNAGANVAEPMLDVTAHHLDQLINLNVRAAFLVAQAAVRKMVEQGNGGVVVNVSSQMGHVGAVNRTAYCMTKHAVEGLTKAMAVELAPQRIRVNSVAPTFIDTAMTRKALQNDEFRSWVLERLPLGRLATEADVANAIVFLASPAAAMITGTSIRVDGGWTAQ